MTVKINHINKKAGKLSANSVLFVDEKFNSNNLKIYFSNEYNIKDLLKNATLKNTSFEVNSKKNYFNFIKKKSKISI